VYQVEFDDTASAEVAALPAAALPALASVVDGLAIHPWVCDSFTSAKPDAPMRAAPFGPRSEGLAVYLILEYQQRVVVLRILWAG
jgi:hypothetical protein